MFAPYDAKTKPIVPDQSFIDANSVIVAGPGSATIGGGCLATGTPALATVFFGPTALAFSVACSTAASSITLPADTLRHRS